METWTLSAYEVYEAAAVAVLFYHNVYEEGKQGGLEIIQQGTRIAGNGNLRLGIAPEQWDVLPRNGKRQVEPDGSLSISCAYQVEGISYTVCLAPDGGSLRLRVDLGEGLPADWVYKVGFNLELMPGAYMGKSFFMDGAAGVFSRQFNQPMQRTPGGS